MLRQLIKIMAEGQVHSKMELARRLEVSERLVEQMLEDLTRMGRLEAVSAPCSAECRFCPLAKECNSEPPVRSWVLTSKRNHGKATEASREG